MKHSLLGASIACVFAVPMFVMAAPVSETYTNENIETTYHEQPQSFVVDIKGNVRGVTVSGKVFTQINVENTAGIRLQRFTIDEAFWYVSDKGVISASSDMIALSIYLGNEGNIIVVKR